ncbi:transposase, partial [Escherichia coli]|nr:transposase [Escherichia coli]EFA5029724.1 transposase [Escherichia coli]
YPEIARCTEREFATILAGISAGGMYCPECGTVHWPDGVTPPSDASPFCRYFSAG